MTIETAPVRGVKTSYGPRQTAEGREGIVQGFGNVKELQVDVRGDTYGVFSATIPAGAKFLEAQAEVVEAFDLGGTTPTINVGTSGSAGTNYGIELSEAQAEAAGTVVYNSTGAGTWASVLAADTTVAVELDGTTPTATSDGLLRVVIRYLVV